MSWTHPPMTFLLILVKLVEIADFSLNRPFLLHKTENSKFYVIKISKFQKISLIQKMVIGPKCRDFEYLKNRTKIEPARAKLSFLLHKQFSL